MILNAHAGTKYGVSFPVLCRASFGVKGANVPAMLRAHRRVRLVRHPDVDRRAGAAHAADARRGPAGPACPAAMWIAFARVLAGAGRRSSCAASRASSCSKLVGAAAARRRRRCCSGGRSRAAAGWATSSASRRGCSRRSTPFWTLFPAALTANVGYWATLSLNIPDFTRYARSQRSQALGQALGLPTTMTAFAFIGVAVTSATIVIFGEAIWDPVVLIARIGSPPVIIFGALVVLAAQLTTNMAANVVSPANDFSSLAPRRISYVTGGLITAVIGIVMMPWKLYADAAAYIFTWLIGYSSLMGAIGGILIADYWVLRRRELSLPRSVRRSTGATPTRTASTARAIVGAGRSRSCRCCPGSSARRRRRAGRSPNPTLLRHALHLRVVRDLRAQRGHLPAADAAAGTLISAAAAIAEQESVRRPWSARAPQP